MTSSNGYIIDRFPDIHFFFSTAQQIGAGKNKSLKNIGNSSQGSGISCQTRLFSKTSMGYLVLA